MAIVRGESQGPTHQESLGFDDPASCAASMSAAYRAGASRTRRRGDHAKLLAATKKAYGHSPGPRLHAAGTRLTWRHRSVRHTNACRSESGSKSSAKGASQEPTIR